MTEKVLGFLTNDWYKEQYFTGRKKEAFWQIKKKDLVPVFLQTESVRVEWLEKEMKRLKVEK